MSESSLYRPEIERIAEIHGLDPDMVEAIVRIESSGFTHAYRYEPDFWRRYLADNPDYKDRNPRRVSASYGLMQIMYPTARERGFSGEPELLFVPVIGLKWGCRHLAWLARLLGYPRAIGAWNGGVGGSRLPFRPDIARYVDRVQFQLQLIRQDTK